MSVPDVVQLVLALAVDQSIFSGKGGHLDLLGYSFLCSSRHDTRYTAMCRNID